MTNLPWGGNIGECLLIQDFNPLPPECDQAIFLKRPEMSVHRFAVDSEHAGEVELTDMQHFTIDRHGTSSQQSQPSRQPVGQLVKRRIFKVLGGFPEV